MRKLLLLAGLTGPLAWSQVAGQVVATADLGGGSGVSILTYGARCDGSTDDTAAIAAAVAANAIVEIPVSANGCVVSSTTSSGIAIPVGAGKTIQGGGTIKWNADNSATATALFKVTGGNVLFRDLVIDGSFQTQTNLASRRWVFSVSGTNANSRISNIRIDGLRIFNLKPYNGTKPATSEVATAIDLYAVDNAVVANTKFSDISGTAVTIASSRNVVVQDNAMDTVRWYPVHINCENTFVSVQRNRISAGAKGTNDHVYWGGAIDLQNNESCAGVTGTPGPVTQYVNIIGNYISGAYEYGGAIRLGSPQHVLVGDNTLEVDAVGTGSAGIKVSPRGSAGTSMTARGIYDLSIRGNTLVPTTVASYCIDINNLIPSGAASNTVPVARRIDVTGNHCRSVSSTAMWSNGIVLNGANAGIESANLVGNHIAARPTSGTAIPGNPQVSGSLTATAYQSSGISASYPYIKRVSIRENIVEFFTPTTPADSNAWGIVCEGEEVAIAGNTVRDHYINFVGTSYCTTPVANDNISITPVNTSYDYSLVYANFTKTSNYTMKSNERFINCDATAGTVAITPPVAAMIGIPYTITKVDSSANECWVAGTTDGVSNLPLKKQYESAVIIQTGTSGVWKMVANARRNMVGDSGSGGTAGLVPAPGAGDAAASKFLKADGTWAVAGSGSNLNFPFTSQTTYALAHNLGTTNVLFACFDNSNNLIEPNTAVVTDSNNITVTFASAQTGRCVVNGGGGGGGGGGPTYTAGTGISIAGTVISVDTATVPTFLSASASINFGSISNQACATNTFTLSGVSGGEAVIPQWPTTLETGLLGIMRVSASNTVEVRLCNLSGGSVDPANQSFGATIVRSF